MGNGQQHNKPEIDPAQGTVQVGTTESTGYRVQVSPSDAIGQYITDFFNINPGEMIIPLGLVHHKLLIYENTDTSDNTVFLDHFYKTIDNFITVEDYANMNDGQDYGNYYIIEPMTTKYIDSIGGELSRGEGTDWCPGKLSYIKYNNSTQAYKFYDVDITNDAPSTQGDLLETFSNDASNYAEFPYRDIYYEKRNSQGSSNDLKISTDTFRKVYAVTGKNYIPEEYYNSLSTEDKTKYDEWRNRFKVKPM